MKKAWLGGAALLLLLGVALAMAAHEAPLVCKGQTLYVPIYSHMLGGGASGSNALAGTLYIRNVDPLGAITVTAIESYDHDGRRGRSIGARPLNLEPLQIEEYVLPPEITKGGTATSLLLRWNASAPVNAPIVECVMANAKTGQVLFVVRAQELVDTRK